jgi:hypothetical protein
MLFSGWGGAAEPHTEEALLQHGPSRVHFTFGTNSSLMKFAKYSDTSGVAPASCRHRRMPPGRRRYDEGLSPYFANISKIDLLIVVRNSSIRSVSKFR